MHPAESTPAGRGAATPRVVGTALVLVSTVAGALAAGSIANPAWSIGAAVLLAVASVGVAAGLLVLRRASWADDAWPAASADVSARQQRRALLVSGAFLLVAGAAGLVGLLLPGAAESELVTRTWWLVGGCGAVGFALVVAGVAPVPTAVATSERPSDDPAALGDSWVRLGSPDPAGEVRELLRPLLNPPYIFVPVWLLSLLAVLADISPWIAGAMLAISIAALAVALAVARRRQRPPWVARDGAALRHGALDVPAAEIDAASLAVVPWQADATERSLRIVLTARGKRRGSVALRKRGRLVLTDGQTAALAALVERSSIELPRDSSDPKGRFSRSSYPLHLTKEDAVAVVREPPGDGEQLPIAAQPGLP